MLELARADNARGKELSGKVELGKLILNALLTFEPVFFERGRMLEQRVIEDIHVQGSAEQLRQIVDILLDNAQKYSRESGKTWVSLQKNGKKRCLLTVENEGEPLSPQEARDIFKRFYRADKARSRTHRTRKDKIERLRVPYQAGVTLDSMANVGHDYSTGIELSGSLQATSWWNTQINGSLYHYRVENEYKTDGKNETSTNYEIAWNNAFTAGKYTRIQLDGNFVGPSVTTQGRTQSFWFVNLAIRQQFFKRKLTATLSFRDVFNTARYVNTITSSNLISKTRIRPDYPLIGLTLSYTFNQFKLKNGLSNNSKDLFEGTNH